jgi:quercetin dioxygenase-like cupin family protein
MKEPITVTRIVHAAKVEWGDHPRFAGIQMKALLTRADNEFANVSQVRVPPGCEVGWHKHATQIETVYLLAGQAILTIGEHESSMAAGSIVAIPAGHEHSLRNVGSDPIELLAFFTPPNS